jgi:hypothetical protein
VKIRLPGYAKAWYPPALGFVDAAGRQWIRDRKGRIGESRAADRKRLEQESPGAYSSEEEHPTLRLDSPEFPLRGKRIE